MRAVLSTILVLMLLAGATLIAYARWTAPLKTADAAMADGQFAQAAAAYQAAEGRFDSLPATKQFIAPEYDRIVDNHLDALYRLKRYDETIDLAQRAPAGAAPHFWAGCAFFEKASVEEQPEARLGYLSRAEEELRKAVESAPADWDTKFDFELTTRLAAELRRQPNTPPRQLMQLLRPPTASGKSPRRVG